MDNTEVILYARDCSTGKELWRFKTSASSSLSDPTITGDYCITNGGDSYTYILDKITGAMIRRFFVSSDLVFGDPKVDQGVIFIGAQNQSFYAFDLNTGQEKWRFQCTNPPQGGFGFNESSCFLGEYVITTTMHGVIYCLNKNTGDPLWKYKIAGIQNTNNFPIVHDDKVYLTTGMQGMLLRIDPFDYR
jgi:outer membrane protein assembly factor BamB